MNRSRNIVAYVLMLIGLVACAAIYWPGLSGGFIYDDFSFIVGNHSIMVTTGSLKEWLLAAMAFPSGTHQGRWLGMLSFALNHFLTGMEPYGFKLTNLAIHLFNGGLVFLMLRALFDVHVIALGRNNLRRQFDGGLAAAVLACLWLVLPINLTAVLYVSQRLESLSTTFIFLGLWWYLRARIAHLQHRRSFAHVWLALITSTVLGVLTKESAVLLPLYTAAIEVIVIGGRSREGRWHRQVLSLYGCLLVVPLVAGLFWLHGWIDGARTYGRAFNIPERLMTESRVLIDYMRWTLAPNLDSLTLYHDDIEISHGLLKPATTIFAIAAIFTLLGVAAWQRSQRPLFSLGIIWFFGGHLLTATVIPLMLAFEHRNYFPSLGLLLAAGSLLYFESNRIRGRIIILAAGCLFVFYSFTTALRAQEWSDPLRLVMAEASKRPRSPDAQFARANLLLRSELHDSDGHSMVDDALLALDNARQLPGAGMLFEQRLITTNAKLHRPIEKKWWDSLIEKLTLRPPNASDARALSNLNHCFIDKLCGDDTTPLKGAYEAAMSHNSKRATLFSVHAEFAWRILDDKEMAESDIRHAVDVAPSDINGRRNLVILLLATNQFGDARKELEVMRGQNWFGFFDDLITPLEKSLKEREAKSENHNP